MRGSAALKSTLSGGVPLAFDAEIQQFAPYSWHFDDDFLDLGQVRHLRERGIISLAYTVNDPARARFLLRVNLRVVEFAIQRERENLARSFLGRYTNAVNRFTANGQLPAAEAPTLLAQAADALLILDRCTATPRVNFLTVRAGESENQLFWTHPATGAANALILFRTDTWPAVSADR